MKYRLNTKVVSLVVILILVAIGLFVHTLITAPDPVVMQTEEVIEEEEVKKSDKIVTAKHQYINGIHTVAGKAEVPTRCHLLDTVPFSNNEKTKFEIQFNTYLEGEGCTTEFFEVPFSVHFEAPQDIEITAKWNGEEIRLNLVPVQEGESIEDEIYIKG